MQQILDTFQRADENGDGRLDKEEFFRVMQDVMPSLTPEDLDLLMSAADADQDGHVDVAEFVSPLASV